MSERGKTILSEELMTAAAGVLGSMLIDEHAVGPMLLAVEEDDFQLAEYRHVFAAMRDLFRRGRPVDAVLVNETLGGGYEQLLIDLMDRTPTAVHADAYAEALKRASRLWQLRQLGEELSAIDGEEQGRVLIDRANLLFCQRASVRRLTMQEGYRAFFDRHQPGKRPDYLKWGMGGLDDEVHAGPGDMVVLGGYPSAGKTALALQMAFHIARSRRVGFFSYETSVDKLHDRLVACQSEISFRRMMTGELQEADYARVIEHEQRLTAPGLEFLETGGMTVSAIGSYAMARHYDVIVVDYLQKIAVPGRYANEAERVGMISNGLQQLGRTTGKTVIALSQLSRPDKGKEGPRAPTMSSLRQSGQIEQDADVVMLLYKEYPDRAESRRVLDVVKNKDGVTEIHVMLRFDGDKQRFKREAVTPPAPKEPECRQMGIHEIPETADMPF